MLQRLRTTSFFSSWVRLVALSMLLGFGLLASSLFTSRPAHAQPLNTVTITDCTDDSQLQSAVANAASGDTINFGCSGDIKLSKTLTIPTSLTLDGSSQNVTLDGNHSVQVLAVNHSGISLTLNALTIANGISNGSSPNGFGGGLINYDGTVTISNSTFANNSAANGGGGIASAFGRLTITNSTFVNNTANGTISAGGGISSQYGTLNVSNSTFVNNSVSTGNGGGIDNAYQDSLTVTNSTFTGNYAGNGGGGGGIDNYQATATITNSTIATNNGNAGGGGINTYQGTLTAKGSIVANNTGGDCLNESGTITDQGYNLDSDSSCFTAATSLHTNPQLSPLANNGGPTQTMALQQGSPAIDQIPVASCPATDQRGVSRPDDSETSCDIGAYESNYQDNDLGLSNMPANITTNATSPQGAVVTYTSPTVVDEDSPLPTASCTPASGSTFAIGTTTVTCTVSDSDDTNSPVSQNFTVTVNPVLAVSVANVTATEGSAFSGVVATGTAYGSSNPLSATITWGDGSSSTVSVTPNADGSYSVSGSHTYAEEGSYPLSVAVKDSGSLSASGSGSAQVADAALTLTHFVAGPLPHHSAGVGATFTDADPAGAVSDYTATINWGDGTTSTVKVIKNPIGQGFVLAGLHSYAGKGTYSVTLTVADQGGSQVNKTVTLIVK